MTVHLAQFGAAVTIGAAALALVVPTAEVPAPVPTDSPATQSGSPWPTMRHDLRNTGASDLVGTDPGTEPWSFTTEVGIFSTPVVSADGTIYVGSADNVLHGLDRTGPQVWRLRHRRHHRHRTGTAGRRAGDRGVVGRRSRATRSCAGCGPIRTCPSPNASSGSSRPCHRRRAAPNWSHGGRAAPTSDRTARSTRATPAASRMPSPRTGRSGGRPRPPTPCGRCPVVDESEHVLLGVGRCPDLRPRCRRSAAVAAHHAGLRHVVAGDGHRRRAVPGSFDGTLYALDRADGSVRWKYQSGDHIYSSPALIEDAEGILEQVVIGSTDGLLHSVAPDGTCCGPTTRALRSAAPRSSGGRPTGGRVVYVGSANGQVRGSRRQDGTRRWAYDTTSARADPRHPQPARTPRPRSPPTAS